MSKGIREMYHRANLSPPDGKGIHTKKFHEMVIGIKKSDSAYNPYAVAMAKLGKKKAVKKAHRR